MLVTDLGPDKGGVREPPARAPADLSPGPADAETPERLRGLFQLVGSVVAPTTLLTALLFYFGWAYSAAYVKYFGLDISLLGLTTQDYLTNSVQALFVPLTAALSAGLLIAWVHARTKTRLFVGPGSGRRLRSAAMASAVCGLVLFGIGMLGIFVVRGEAQFSVWFPLSFGAGAVLLAYGSRLHARSERSTSVATGARSTAVLEVTGAFFLVALSLFWGATNYAAAVGTTKARDSLATILSGPQAILYSKEPLYLEAPGIRETSCGEPAGGYRFRYDGLRLMIRSAGKYFFVPATWSRADGMAVVVPESDGVRLQFAAPVHDDRRAVISPELACPSPPRAH